MEKDEKDKLFLIGYMGTGKTTLGKLLAEKLNWTFIDIDWFIENRYRQTIPVIFEEKGEAGFREMERRALHEISGFENVVVSTGGGLPCFFDNMDLMNQVGITIYLKASANDLLVRLNSGKKKRPLIKGKKPEELREFIEMNLKQREQFYSQAKFSIDVPYCPSKKEMYQWVEELSIKISAFFE